MKFSSLLGVIVSTILAAAPAHFAWSAVETVDVPIMVYSRPEYGVLLQADGNEARVLFNQGVHVAPRLSPKGGQLLFNSVEGGKPGIWLLTLTGEEDLDEQNDKRRICDGAQADWSPDGTRIVFCREGRLIERDMATAAETTVSPADASPLAFPTYMPDGGFICVNDAGTAIYRIQASGKDIQKLRAGEIGGAARCSPDGQWVAYQDGAHITLLELATGQTRQLTVGPGVEGWPIWSADSQELCYAYAATPFDKEWNLYHTTLATPNVVSRIATRLSPTFDWIGPSPEVWTSKTLSGVGLELWHGDTPMKVEPGTGMQGKLGWETVPDTAAAPALKGGVAVENDWFTLTALKTGITLTSKSEKTPLIKLAVLKQDRHPAGAVTACEVLSRTPESIRIKVSFEGAALALRVFRTRPMLECVSMNNVAGITAQTPMAAIIIPDRLANDVIVNSGAIAPGVRAALPAAPVALGCLAESHGLLMFVSTVPVTKMSARNGASGQQLDGLSATCSDAPVTLALLDNSALWEQAALKQGQGRGRRRKWDIDGNMELSAQWRMAVYDAQAAYARMCDGERARRFKNIEMPLADLFAEVPDTALLYVWGRDSDTPPTVLTPNDILLDVLAQKAYAETLDIAGIRSYRQADQWVPFLEIVTHSLDWNPGEVGGEHVTYGLLETLGCSFPARTDGSVALTESMGADIISLLQGLDGRASEYEQLLEAFIAYCDEQEGAAFEAAGAALEKALESGRAIDRTDLGDLGTSLDTVVALVRTAEDWTIDDMRAWAKIPGNDLFVGALKALEMYMAAPEGRCWRGGVVCHELWYEDTFRSFVRLCWMAQVERQRMLTLYREAIKKAADQAGRAITRTSAFKAAGDALRVQAHQVLRSRYYLERDWRGEAPLSDEDLLLPVDQAKGQQALRPTSVQ